MRTDLQKNICEKRNSEKYFVLCFQGFACLVVRGVTGFVRTLGSDGGMG